MFEKIKLALEWANVCVAGGLDDVDCSMSTFYWNQHRMRVLEEGMGRLDENHASVWQRLAWLISDVRFAACVCYASGAPIDWNWGDSYLLDAIHATALAGRGSGWRALRDRRFHAQRRRTIGWIVKLRKQRKELRAQVQRLDAENIRLREERALARDRMTELENIQARYEYLVNDLRAALGPEILKQLK